VHLGLRGCLDQLFKGSDGEFLGRGGSIQKINKFDMSEIGLCPFMIVLLSRRSRIESLRIATTIFVRKIDTQRAPNIHINHTYPIVMTIAPVVLANLRQSQ
jgi:hypothetical protein